MGKVHQPGLAMPAQLAIDSDGKVYGVIGPDGKVYGLGLGGNLVNYETNPVTGGMVFSAGGDNELLAKAGVKSPISGALKAILVGHSYLDEESGTYSYNRPMEFLQGTVGWANILLGRPWEIVRAHAIGGERLIDLADRIESAIAENPDIVFWNIGINDLKNTKNAGNSRFTGKPYPVDANQTNVAYCIGLADLLLSKLSRTGALIVILPETWPANGAADQTKHLAARTLQYNDFLRWRAANDPRMVYVPLDSYTADPTSATGDVRAGYYNDYIHPSNVGGFARGAVLASHIKSEIKRFDRLSANVIETFNNLKIAGTALAANGNDTLRVTLNNTSGSNTLIRTGDKVALAVPSPGNVQWNGRYNVVAHTTTYIDVDCAVPGAYTGTVNVSTATQVFDNPLFLTQTGGGVSGGITLAAGTVPSEVSISGPAGCSVSMDNAQVHTDMDGVADGFGNWCDMTITGPANAAVDVFFLANRGPAATGSTVYGRLFSGDTVQALFDVDVVSISGVYTFIAGLNGAFTHATDGSQNLLIYGMYRDGVNTGAHPNQPFRGVVGTAEYAVPAGTLEAFDGHMNVKFGASGGSIRLRVGRVAIKALQHTMRDTSKPFDL